MTWLTFCSPLLRYQYERSRLFRGRDRFGVRKMTALARLFSIIFPEADERSDEAFPVLMFTAIGLAAVICFVLMNGTPSSIEFQAF